MLQGLSLKQVATQTSLGVELEGVLSALECLAIQLQLQLRQRLVAQQDGALCSWAAAASCRRRPCSPRFGCASKVSLQKEIHRLPGPAVKAGKFLLHERGGGWPSKKAGAEEGRAGQAGGPTSKRADEQRGLFAQEVQETARNWRYQEQVAQASRSVLEVEARLRRAEEECKVGAAEDDVGVGEKEKKSGPVVWDWASSYQKFSAWEDVEDLRDLKSSEEARMRTIMERGTNLGHYHDHDEERKVFELPENEKMSICERHRLLGNALYQEGAVHKAAENYKLALSYYEYCFPESEEGQHNLDSVRYASLCNISLCYRRMGHLRLAVDAASKALAQASRGKPPGSGEGHHAESGSAKAYFRRAQAYSDLDEYSSALADLRAALCLAPNDAAILREMDNLARIKACSAQADQRLAQAMLPLQSVPAHLRGECSHHASSGLLQCTPNDGTAATAAAASLDFQKLVWGDLTMPLEPWGL